MSEILSYAFAKVNLLLNINRKTEYGYHEMESVFLFLSDIYDILEFETDLEFNEDSAFIKGIENSKNSIKQAYEILKSNFKDKKIPHVDIKKYIPIEGGLGGGSSDSSCFVNSVFNFWGFDIKEKFKYIDLFKSLGSDAIVFLHKYFLDENLLFLDGTGIDGIIKPIKIPELKDKFVLLVNNGKKISTKLVFENLDGDFSSKIGFENCNFENIKNFKNSLQKSAILLEPSIDNILEEIKDTYPMFYGLSGSGATCFAIYKTLEKANIAKNNLNYNFLKISKI